MFLRTVPPATRPFLRYTGAARNLSRMSGFVTIHGQPIPLDIEPAAEHIPVAAILNFKPLQQWASAIDDGLVVKSLTVQSVDLFGPRVGFVKMKVSAALAATTDKLLPGVVFLRGGAVSILLILVCEGKEYVVCCRQPRVPVGMSKFLEIPAGMLDDAGHFAGVAAKELEEETGIVLDADQLVDLTAVAYEGAEPESMPGPRDMAPGPGKLRGMYPSVGACDEFLRLYYARRYVTGEYLDALRGRLCGNAEENEQITLELLPYHELWWRCPDAKTLSSILLREKLLATGKIRDEYQTAANVLTLSALPK